MHAKDIEGEKVVLLLLLSSLQVDTQPASQKAASKKR
jgi:hypothetical protein